MISGFFASLLINEALGLPAIGQLLGTRGEKRQTAIWRSKRRAPRQKKLAVL